MKEAHLNLTQEWDKGDYEHANKGLIIVPGASHCDLYDQIDIIPFDDIEKFYREYLA